MYPFNSLYVFGQVDLAEIAPYHSVSEKVFDMPDIMSEAYRSSIGHFSVSIGHWEHMMLILHDYCRTICPTFCPKTSDIGVKTSDMSGCPTVFQKH